ncbi:hypothetical protein DACRYDRAFT_24041 [Dacryopinax primogenitus]|uniref:Cytochrome P450 n=1 Tax=Dacryopinax primogenitus (strain DJM 731) TaxID=1858805 RepID=M5FTY1_DACPD|nr:uncharacterized protein DACRYDRAFT_24041 [Dacryopinax primogenitus]EJT98929.1 hypothetical protein DACRYDRAFT_24041 [Dacryopinax primogenitus]
MQENEAATLAFGLLHHPEISFVQHTRRFSASVIFQCLYGGEAIPLTGIDRSKRMSEFTEQIGRTLQPQKSVVDMFPFLKPVIWTVKWLRKEADEWHDEVEAEATQLWESAAPSDVRFMSAQTCIRVIWISMVSQKHRRCGILSLCCTSSSSYCEININAREA